MLKTFMQSLIQNVDLRATSVFPVTLRCIKGALKGYAGGRTSQKLYAKYI